MEAITSSLLSVAVARNMRWCSSFYLLNKFIPAAKLSVSERHLPKCTTKWRILSYSFRSSYSLTSVTEHKSTERQNKKLHSINLSLLVSVTALEMLSNVTLSESEVTIARVRTLFISRYRITSTPLDLILHKHINKTLC